MKPTTIVSVLQSSSAGKDVALRRALSLAHWYDADLHVIRVDSSTRVGDESVGLVRNDLVRRIARVAEESGTATVSAVPAVLSGRPVQAITDYTSRVAADLVVVGNDARLGIGYWATGSFAATVGNTVRAATIAIPDQTSQGTNNCAPFRNILCAIDFSDASLGAVSVALKLAQQSGGQLRLLHVLDGFPFETVYSASRAFGLTDDLRAHAARVNRRLNALIPPDALNWIELGVTTVSGKAHRRIISAASAPGTDLVVLGFPRLSRLEQAVLGSTVHQVLRGAMTPVLLVPGPSRPSLFSRAHENEAQLATSRSAFGLRSLGRAAGATEGRAS